MEVSVQLHVLADLPPGRSPLVPIRQETGRVPEPAWSTRRRENLSRFGTPIFRRSSPQTVAIATALSRLWDEECAPSKALSKLQPSRCRIISPFPLQSTDTSRGQACIMCGGWIWKFLYGALRCLERSPWGSRISYERLTKWTSSAACGSYGN
jgi:hypothetical protein